MGQTKTQIFDVNSNLLHTMQLKHSGYLSNCSNKNALIWKNNQNNPQIFVFLKNKSKPFNLSLVTTDSSINNIPYKDYWAIIKNFDSEDNTVNLKKFSKYGTIRTKADLKQYGVFIGLAIRNKIILNTINNLTKYYEIKNKNNISIANYPITGQKTDTLQLGGKLNINLSYYLEHANLSKLSLYLKSINNKDASFINETHSSNSDVWAFRNSEIITNLEDLFSDFINSNTQKNENSNLNNKYVTDTESFINNYRSVKSFKKITDYDDTFITYYKKETQHIENTINIRADWGWFLYPTEVNFNFDIKKNLINILKINPENLIYNFWNNLFNFQINLKKYNKIRIYLKKSKENFKIGHIDISNDYKKSFSFLAKQATNSALEKTSDFVIVDNNLYLKKLKKNNKYNFNYKIWGSEFSDFNSKFENKITQLENIKSKYSILRKNSNNLNMGDSAKVSTNRVGQVEEVLQRIEQMFVVYLGNNYLREVIYSHYGSWIPKYGFFSISNSNTLNPEGLTSWNWKNKKVMDDLVSIGDWVNYFEYRSTVSEWGELNFIKNYIFTKKYICTKIRIY